MDQRRTHDRASIPAADSASQREQETVALPLGGGAGLDLPEVFGRYRVLKPLGAGAMGAVYLAEDTQLQRNVALKTPHFQAGTAGERLDRFFREARAAAALRHPNICPVHDVGEIGGRHYISMAFIEGQPLSAYTEPGRLLSERQALALVRKLALALQEAHDRRVIHRDLKPANVMIDRRGEPIIMDFGLARRPYGDDESHLTQSGTIVGSPAYMSPEQVQGDPDQLTPAADQYSLGVILYELLTGQRPFRGSVTSVIAQVLTTEPPAPRSLRPEISPPVEAICLQMMRKNASERFASMKAVADAVGSVLRQGAKPQAAGEKPRESPETPAPPPSEAPSDDLDRLALLTLTDAAAHTLPGRRPTKRRLDSRNAVLAVAAALLVLAALVIYSLSGRQPADDRSTGSQGNSVSPSEGTAAAAGSAVFPPASDGWVDLFNGRDLSGWSVHAIEGKQPPVTWSADAARNILVAHAGGHSWLETDKTYGDFDLSLEWRFPSAAAVDQNGSGVVLRATDTNSTGSDPKGVEVDLLLRRDAKLGIGPGCFVTYNTRIVHDSGASPSFGTGHLERLHDPTQRGEEIWTRLEISCRADRIQASIGGILVNEAREYTTKSGAICLRNQNSDVQFRNIRIREYTP